MSVWRYVEPGPDGEEVYILTEREILQNYLPIWTRLMWRAGKQKEISAKGCLEDWVTVHYAERVE